MRRLILMCLMVFVSIVPAGTIARAQPAADASPVTGTGCTGDPAAGLLLYHAWPSGLPGGDLIVADGAGHELRRIDLPPTRFGLGTLAPGRALYWTTSSEIYLVDAHAGTATRLDIPAAAVDAMAPFAPLGWGELGTKWWPLGGVRQPNAFLINLETGATHDIGRAIAATGDEFTQMLAAFIAPDSEHLLIWTGAGLYLIAAEDPAHVRVLGSGERPATPGYFRDGGAELFYSRAGDGQQTEFVIEDLASGTEAVFSLWGGSKRRAILQPLPDPNRALLIWISGDALSPEGTALEVLTLDSGRARFLISPLGSIGVPLVSPDGDRALLGGPGEDTLAWRFVDLRTGHVSVVNALNGLFGSTSSLGGRWALFFPDAAIGPGTDGAHYVGLDLETGEARILMTQRADFEYAMPVSSRGDHRYAVIEVRNEGRASLLLFDLATGKSRTIAEGDTAVGVFSPDGCWVAAATEGGAGSSLQLIPVGTGAPVPLPGGSMPVWVQP